MHSLEDNIIARTFLRTFDNLVGLRGRFFYFVKSNFLFWILRESDELTMSRLLFEHQLLKYLQSLEPISITPPLRTIFILNTSYIQLLSIVYIEY